MQATPSSTKKIASMKHSSQRWDRQSPGTPNRRGLPRQLCAVGVLTLVDVRIQPVLVYVHLLNVTVPGSTSICRKLSGVTVGTVPPLFDVRVDVAVHCSRTLFVPTPTFNYEDNRNPHKECQEDYRGKDGERDPSGRHVASSFSVRIWWMDAGEAIGWSRAVASGPLPRRREPYRRRWNHCQATAAGPRIRSASRDQSRRWRCSTRKACLAHAKAR